MEAGRQALKSDHTTSCVPGMRQRPETYYLTVVTHLCGPNSHTTNSPELEATSFRTAHTTWTLPAEGGFHMILLFPGKEKI